VKLHHPLPQVVLLVWPPIVPSHPPVGSKCKTNVNLNTNIKINCTTRYRRCLR